MNTHYGAFKRCNEDNARVYFLENGVNSVGLRAYSLWRRARHRRDLRSDQGDEGRRRRAAFHIRFGGKTDFLYVADCADAFIRAASADLEGSHVFNSHGESVEMAAVVEEIEKLIPEAEGRITFDPTPLALPPELDDSAIVRALGDIPHTPLSQGMKETIERFAFLRRAGIGHKRFRSMSSNTTNRDNPQSQSPNPQSSDARVGALRP